jgi:hypothetical protein
MAFTDIIEPVDFTHPAVGFLRLAPGFFQFRKIGHGFDNALDGTIFVPDQPSAFYYRDIVALLVA